MSIYRFNAGSQIDEVAIRRSDGGGIRAYLHAREGADPATLAGTKRKR